MSQSSAGSYGGCGPGGLDGMDGWLSEIKTMWRSL